MPDLLLIFNHERQKPFKNVLYWNPMPVRCQDAHPSANPITYGLTWIVFIQVQQEHVKVFMYTPYIWKQFQDPFWDLSCSRHQYSRLISVYLLKVRQYVRVVRLWNRLTRNPNQTELLHFPYFKYIHGLRNKQPQFHVRRLSDPTISQG